MSWPKFNAIILVKFMSGTRLGVAPTNVQSRIAGRLARVGQFVGEVLFDQSRARHKFIYIYCLEVLWPSDVRVIHVLPDFRAKSFSQIYVGGSGSTWSKPCALWVQGKSCPEFFVKFMSGHWLVSSCLSNTHTKNTPAKTRPIERGSSFCWPTKGPI
jgi:hypothetical protein